MDTREKFNIKLMVDCERLEPFYPVTHAAAVKIIKDGEIFNLLDIANSILNFILTWGNISITDLLQLGYEEWNAFPGNEGKAILDYLFPRGVVEQDNNHPVTGGTVFDYVNTSFAPDGVVEENNEKAVSGGTVYEYLMNLLNGEIAENSVELVTGGTIYNYLYNLYAPTGTINNSDTKPVSGKTVKEALDNLNNVISSLEQNVVWAKGTANGSIKSKNSNGLISNKENEVVFGNYNKSIGGIYDSILEIGIGSSDSNRKNAMYVKKDFTNSLYVPFDDSTNNNTENVGYVSIQLHFSNNLVNKKHLTAELLEKLNVLISERWVGKFTFNANSNGGNYYNNNTGIRLSWEFLDKNNNPASSNLNFNIKVNNLLNNTVYNLLQNSNTPVNNNYLIDNYNNLSVYALNSSGKTELKFTLNGTHPDINSGNTFSSEKYVRLYAPSYIFSSIEDNVQSIPNESNFVYITDFNNFDSSIEIPSGNPLYIYIALPLFLNIESPSDTYRPLKDFNYGIEFSLLDGYTTATLSYTVCGYQITVNYKIIRSASRLDPMVWHIVNKNKN